MHVPEIEVAAARCLLDEAHAVFVDIRDVGSYAAGHVRGAWHLTSDTVERLLDEISRDTPVVVYCYRGISSLQATAWLRDRGFVQAVSLTGGYDAWRASFPGDTDIVRRESRWRDAE